MSSTSAGAAKTPRDSRSIARGPSAREPRLWPLAEALDHLRGFVAELAGFNGKCATLSIEASPVLVTPDLISAAVPALVQLLRNAITHGVEPPMERLMAGKPLGGTLTLLAELSAGVLRFVVRDDGRGVHPTVALAGPEALGRGFAEAIDRVAPLGGRIAMLPGVPRGAAFVLTLPLQSGQGAVSTKGLPERE